MRDELASILTSLWRLFLLAWTTIKATSLESIQRKRILSTRATILVDIGEPILYEKYMADYNEGGLKKREAVSSLLNDIYLGVKNVTTTASNWDLNNDAITARRIYTQSSVHLDTENKVKIQRHFIEAYEGKEEFMM